MNFGRVLRLLHFVGLVTFLGSIFTYIAISALTRDASLENLAFARRIIATGTNVLTLPGMWVLAATGLWMGYRRYGLSSRFFRIKLLLVALVVVDAHVIVVPAAHAATEIAIRSVGDGHLFPEYGPAYLRETIAGAVNVLLTLAAAVVGVWRIGAR